MKKFLLTVTLTLAATAFCHAQFTGEGYYRVRNVGLQKINSKDNYVYATDSKINVIEQNGTGQTFEPLQLWEGLDNAIASPATVIYATGTVNDLKLAAQSIDVTQITGGRVLKLNSTGNFYRISTVAAGASIYLYSTSKVYANHFIGTTVANSNIAYSYWEVLPITTDGDNYVGVKPTLNAAGKYYAPYYAAYPFKLHSQGMKAYYVSYSNNTSFMLTEIEQEVIPAGTPVLIECASDNISDNRLELLTGDYAAIADNKLSGVYFCNDFISEDASTSARTRFDASAMRVWNVENDQLVLSTATDQLHTSYYASEAAYRYLKANQSYLPVSAGAASTLTISADAIIDVKDNAVTAVPVSYTALDGTTDVTPFPGVNIVKYSDGSVAKVVY